MYRRAALKYNYGITIDQYNAMLAAQGGGCALCGAEPKRRPLDVDHCHETGKVRGLLCNKCNTSLGRLGDTLESILKIVSYLEP